MKTKNTLWKITLVLAPLALSQLFCGQTKEAASPTQDEYAVATSVAETLAAQQVVTAPPVVITEQPAQPPVQPPPAQPGALTVSVSLDTKCRVGPSPDYPQISFLLPGQVATVHGRNDSSTWWYIEDPKQPGQFCWLWGEYATVQGEVSLLPVTTAEPLEPEEIIPPDPVAGYVNEEYGFYLEPGAWSYDASHPNVLSLTKGEYKLIICYENQGEDVMCRTGLPAGDWANGGFFTLLGSNYRKDLITYKNKIKVASYGAGPIDVDGLTLEIWLDGTNPNYDAIDIPNNILNEVDQIMASFGLIE